MTFIRHLALLVIFALYAGQPSLAADFSYDVPRIAAAADLKFALSEIATLFERETGRKLSLSFGSSGVFRRQIEEGAPFELFFSADEAYVDALIQAGRGEGAGAAYAVGRLTLFVPHGSTIRADARLEDLQRATRDGRLKRLAIANPEHAPYGRAAREALMNAGVWQTLQGKLVLGENAAQAARFAVSGSAQAGLIPYSLALAPEIARQGNSILLTAELYAPLRQKMLLLKGARETSRLFYTYMRQPRARAILLRHGFEAPVEGQKDTK